MTNGIISSEDMPGHLPSVACVVLNWNGWKDTIPCLHSLISQDYLSLQILVVDNASTDDSVERIREAFPAIDILPAGGNNGFASGCNVGIRVALERGADFVWLLNNDTVAPPDTLTRLVAAGAGPKTGIVGTVLHYAHDPAKVQAWGGGSVLRWIGFVRHFYQPTPLDSNSFLTFASVLLRRELLETSGLLDEGFFMYFEDSDFCFRARAAGWQLVVAPDTAVLHKEGGSAPPHRNPRVDRVVTASGLRFLSRYGKPLAPVLFVLSRLGKRILRGDFAGVRAVLSGVSDWRDAPAALKDKP